MHTYCLPPTAPTTALAVVAAFAVRSASFPPSHLHLPAATATTTAATTGLPTRLLVIDEEVGVVHCQALIDLGG